MKTYTRWTKLELDRLRQCYAKKMKGEDLAREFAPRTLSSIQSTAFNLGLATSRQRRMLDAVQHYYDRKKP
jgi:hypothetical protein